MTYSIHRAETGNGSVVDVVCDARGMAGHPGVWWSSTEFPDGVSGHAYIIMFPIHPQMTSWASALMTVMDFHLSIDSDHVPDLMSGMAGHSGVWWSSTEFPDGVSGHAYIIMFPNSSPDDIMGQCLDDSHRLPSEH